MGNRAIAETVIPAAPATTPSRARNDAASSSATADREVATAPQITAATPKEEAESDHPERRHGQRPEGDRHGGQPRPALFPYPGVVEGGTHVVVGTGAVGDGGGHDPPSHA